MDRAVVALAAALLAVAGAFVAVGQANAAAGCSVTYSANSWGTGFTANLSVTNLGDQLTSWTLEWDYAGNQTVQQGWNATFSQSGQHVTAKNVSYNGTLAANATTTFGFNGAYSGTNADPTSFKLNGTTCTGSVGGGTTPPTTPPTTPTTTPPGNGGTHVDNPYAGGKGYVNPEWSAEASGDGGSAIANQPTAVWLDRVAAINGVNGGMGLKAHLDAAVSQGASYIQFVIYDLPGRDCAALASNGEFGPTDIAKYETQYIDPIAQIMSDPKYANLKIINVIEPDSLPNLVTNTNGTATQTAECNTMLQNGNYVTGVQYALNKLHAISNVYNYIDAAHHGWLGWSSNFAPSATLFANVVRGTTAGFNSVDGFITDTANYSPVTEPYLKLDDQTRQSDWVDFNDYVDEGTFATAFRSQLISDGFNSNIGMLIDTSRDGWGGPDRPTGPSTASDINTRVNAERVDRRPHVGDWCNQAGSGLGPRPTASPSSGIDAYVWVKPPGESDGSSTNIPNDEGKGFDQMCDPTYGGNPRNNNHPTGALPNSPLSGHWFSAMFHQLLANAFPPVS